MKFLIISIFFLLQGCSLIKQSSPVNLEERHPTQVGLSCIQLIDSLMTEPMTKNDAQELFSTFVDHPKLIWGASNTGCEAKADLMAEIAHKKGYEVSKIWVQPTDTRLTFEVALNQSETETTQWRYHVAILIKVRDGSEDKVFVVDPSLFNEPVPVEEWTSWMSKYADRTGIELDFKESTREAFYSAIDSTNEAERASALLKREEILANASNLEDPVVLEGYMMKKRGEFVDSLLATDRKKVKQLKKLLVDPQFNNWFKSSLRADELSSSMSTASKYYGIPVSEIKNNIDMNDIFASVELKKQYWEKVGNSINKLKKHAHSIVNQPETDANIDFHLSWRNSSFQFKWFSPFAEDLWQKFGVDVDKLPN